SETGSSARASGWRTCSTGCWESEASPRCDMGSRGSQHRDEDGSVTRSRSTRRRPLEGGPSSSGDCRARPYHSVVVSLHLVVRPQALAHKRLPVVALEGLGARVAVALLHLLLLGLGAGFSGRTRRSHPPTPKYVVVIRSLARSVLGVPSNTMVPWSMT